MDTLNGSEQNKLAVEPDGVLVEAATRRTPRGTLYFRRRVPVSRLEKMRLDEGLGIFFRYDLERQHENLLKIARMEYGNVIVAHTAEDLIAGYISMHLTDQHDRWSILNKPGSTVQAYDFGAIEVGRNWRGMGVSKGLLQAAFEGDSWFEDKIVTSVEFSWHWDNEELGMTKFNYRNMLKKVLESAGFNKMDTDEPNVMMDSANMFMVRIGPKVDPAIEQRFYSMLHKNNLWGL